MPTSAVHRYARVGVGGVVVTLSAKTPGPPCNSVADTAVMRGQPRKSGVMVASLLTTGQVMGTRTIVDSRAVTAKTPLPSQRTPFEVVALRLTRY
jgi:hypothetical protein